MQVYAQGCICDAIKPVGDTKSGGLVIITLSVVTDATHRLTATVHSTIAYTSWSRWRWALRESILSNPNHAFFETFFPNLPIRYDTMHCIFTCAQKLTRPALSAAGYQTKN